MDCVRTNNIYLGEDEVVNIGDVPESKFYKNSITSWGSFLATWIYPSYHPVKEDSEFFILKPHAIHTRPGKDKIDYVNDYHILFLGGNCMTASEMKNLVFDDPSDQKKIDANLYEIGLPRVTGYDFSKMRWFFSLFWGKSKGAEEIVNNTSQDSGSCGKLRNSHDAVRAVILWVEALVRKGVDPEKIMLCGTSFGAGIATVAAAHLHSQGKRVTIYNDRTFSWISAVIAMQALHILRYLIIMGIILTTAVVSYGLYKGYAGVCFYYASTALVGVLGSVVLATISLISCVYLSNWEIDVAGAFKSIPNYYKHLAYIKDDIIIPNWANLFKTLKYEKNIARSNEYQTTQKFNHTTTFKTMTRNVGENKSLTAFDDFAKLLSEMKYRNQIKAWVVEFLEKVNESITYEGRVVEDAVSKKKITIARIVYPDDAKQIEILRDLGSTSCLVNDVQVRNAFLNAITKYKVQEVDKKDLNDLIEFTIERVMTALYKHVEGTTDLKLQYEAEIQAAIVKSTACSFSDRLKRQNSLAEKFAKKRQ